MKKQSEELEISIKEPSIKLVLKKYKPFLSKKDVRGIIKESLQHPALDFEAVVIEYLEQKYTIETFSEEQEEEYTYKEIMQELGLSKKRFYFLLNYLGKFVIKKRIDDIVNKGKILKINHDKKDQRSVKTLLKHKKLERKTLLNPGPVLTSWNVKNALIQHDICHRDSDFERLLKRLKKNMLKVFDANNTYSTLFVSGSGTAGVESVISSIIPKGKKLLILSNGAFGERIKEIANTHKISSVHIKKQWGQLFDLTEIKEQIKLHPEIFAIAVCHHETSVGVLNPIHQIGQICKQHNKLFVVDAISSLGAEKLSVVKDNIDVCITSSNKCIHSFSGVAPICIHNKVWELTKDVSPRGYYLDLKKHRDYIEEGDQTPYTPFVASLFALDKAVQELLREGVEMRRLKYMELNSILKVELARLGFEFFSNHDCQSCAILTVKIPSDINFKKFYSRLKQHGFIIYGCKEPLKDTYFQIANMGALSKSMIYDFIFAVKDTLKKLRKNAS